MNSERRLKLVHSADADATLRKPLRRDEFDKLDEPLPTEEELALADALKDALAGGGDPLTLALQAASGSAELSEAEHDAILAKALGDLDAPATEAEQKAAQRLGDELSAMDEGQAPSNEPSEPAVMAGVLRAVWSPRPISLLRNEAMIASALRKTSNEGKSGSSRFPLSMVVFAVVAAAAGVLLFAGQANLFRTAEEQSAAAPRPVAASVAQADMIPARTTVDLFDPATPFPKMGGNSERMDRIMSARSSDLRKNRFAAWGVR